MSTFEIGRGAGGERDSSAAFGVGMTTMTSQSDVTCRGRNRVCGSVEYQQFTILLISPNV